MKTFGINNRINSTKTIFDIFSSRIPTFAVPHTTEDGRTDRRILPGSYIQHQNQDNLDTRIFCSSFRGNIGRNRYHMKNIMSRPIYNTAVLT